MATNPEKLKLVKKVGQTGANLCMDRVPNSGRIFFGSSDARVYEIDLDAEKPAAIAFGPQVDPKAKSEDEAKNDPMQPAQGHTSYVMGVAYTGKYVVSGAYDRKLVWWDAVTRQQVRVVENSHDRWIRGVFASPDKKIIASVADDMVCNLWDADSGKKLHELRGHEVMTPNHYRSMLFAAEFSHDGKLLATCDKVGHVVVWDVATGKQVATFESPENYTWDPKQRRHSIGGARSVAFSADSSQIAVGGIGKIGNIDHLGGPSLTQTYDWKTGNRIQVFSHDKHKGLIERLAYDPAGKWLLGGGGAHGGFLLYMDLKTGKFIKDEDAKFHIHRFQLNETADRVYAVGNGNLAVWEFKAEEEKTEKKSEEKKG
jgi:WD40 repeat protein